MDVVANIVKLNDGQLKRLKYICNDNVEVARKFDSKNSELLKQLQSNHNCHYHQLIWKLSGNINIQKMIEGYNRLLSDCAELRTNYMVGVLDEDYIITFEQSNKVFPITDISGMSKKTQACKIISVAAAESRRSYNPCKSPAIRIQVFIISDEVIIAVISFIPEFCKDISRNTLMSYLFSGMYYEHGALEHFSESASDINDTLRGQNVEYWTKVVNEIGPSLTIPGELLKNKRSGDMESLTKCVDGVISAKLNMICSNYAISKRSIYTYAWLRLLGSYHKQDKPMIAIVGNYGEPGLYPVEVNCNETMEEGLKSLDSRFAMAGQYGYIEESDSADIFGRDFAGRFHAQYLFVDMDKMIDDDEWLYSERGYANNGIELTLRYTFDHGTCSINYTYDNGLFVKEGIETLHSIYETVLNRIIANSKLVIEHNDFANVTASKEEHDKKASSLAKKTLMESALFGFTNDEVAELVGACVIDNVSVDDELYSTGDTINHIGIVVSGDVEEWIADSQGLGRSLRVLKAGEIFGVEALLDNNVVGKTYTVASTEATICWISCEELEKVMKRDPRIWKNILQSVHEHLWKMERIWLIQ